MSSGWPPAARRGGTEIAWATLDLSGPYRSVFDTMLPDAVQVADPFHVVKLANSKLDECRRRVQNETLGHRGRKDDPLYRCRRLLTKADERLDDQGRTKLLGLLDAGDPHGRGAHGVARQRSRPVDSTTTPIPTWPSTFVERLGHDLQDESCPPEVRSARPHHAALAGPDRRLAPSPRVATGRPKPPTTSSSASSESRSGSPASRNYRIRVLLYAGRPNWDLLATITPR